MILRRAVPRRATVPLRFIILTPGRAGSILLLNLLDSHPRVTCDHELFGQHATGARTLRRFADPDRRLARATKRAAATGAAAWGWSLHPAQLITQGVPDREGWCGRFHDRGGRIVTLVRENPVHQALSALIAGETGRWHHREAGGGITPVHLDPLRVLEAIQQAEHTAQEVERLIGDRSHLALRYEDALHDPERHQATADRVFRFLQLDPVPVSADVLRRTVPLRAQILNYEELVEVLSSTPHRGRLGEGSYEGR